MLFVPTPSIIKMITNAWSIIDSDGGENSASVDTCSRNLDPGQLDGLQWIQIFYHGAWQLPHWGTGVPVGAWHHACDLKQQIIFALLFLMHVFYRSFYCFTGQRIPVLDTDGGSAVKGFKLRRQPSESTRERTCCWRSRKQFGQILSSLLFYFRLATENNNR